MNNQNVTGLVGAMNQTSETTGALWWKETNAVNFEPYGAGFVGLSENSVEDMKNLVTTNIINTMNEAIEGFGATQDVIEQGLKGQAAAAATDYVAKIKTLLEAYVSTYKNFITLMESTFEAMKTNDEGNAALIQDASNQIQQMADQIRVD